MANLQQVIGSLPQEIVSEHFIFRYGDRSPAGGPGLGFRGVRDRRLVLIYVDALERLYAAMASGELGRKPPVVGHRGKTMVYVFDSSDIPPFYGSPFTDVDPNGIPYIGLQARSNEPTIEAALQRARADATHEGTHIFNFRERHPQDPYSAAWAWFDEGTAVFMETCVFRGNPDTLRYAMNWVDRPEVSLDDWAYRYESGLFVRYLASRVGPKFLSDVWMTGQPQETPLETIGRLLSQSGSNTCELFREYCIDAFFLGDHARPAFLPEVYARYGERTVAERFDLRPGAKVTRDLTLPHLACQYFRVNFTESVNTVQIRASSGSHEMRFDAVGVQPIGMRNATTSLPSGTVTLSTQDTEHFVLIASHCGTSKGLAAYQLEISGY